MIARSSSILKEILNEVTSPYDLCVNGTLLNTSSLALYNFSDHLLIFIELCKLYTNEVVINTERFVKLPNVYISNMPIFLLKKTAKASTFVQQKI